MTTHPVDQQQPTDALLERSVGHLVDDARDVRAAATLLAGSAPDMQQRYADDVATSLATLELDLGVARATLDARQADSTEDIHRAMREVETAARTWLDELALQSRLARMEARDATGRLAQKIARAEGEASRAATRLSDTVESDLEQIRRVALHGIGEIRSVLADAASAVRDLAE